MASEAGYRVVLDARVEKVLDKMDGSVRLLILSYIKKRLVGCSDPRSLGRGLTGEHAGQWRYRVGDYRILAEIRDTDIVIYVFKIGHRRDVYH
jgi:mRNA interferase RelE/StbE